MRHVPCRSPRQFSAAVSLAIAALGGAGAHAAVHDVVVNGFAFEPPTIEIAVGDTVRWTYQSFHNVVQVNSFATACPQPTPSGFNSGPVGSNTMFQFTFASAGEFFYICQAHCFSEMRGTVTVLSECPGDTNGDRIVNFADLNTVLSQFGQGGAPGSLAGDVNDDGLVNFSDLNIVLSAFGTAC